MIVFTILGVVVTVLAALAGFLFAGAFVWEWIARHYNIQRDLIIAFREVQRKRRGESEFIPA